MAMYDSKSGVSPDVDAIFATSWETAYPVFLDASDAKRFYFVQDFEPAFYPVGTESLLAENTYRFGFHGITAGGWLEQKLHDEFGMPTDRFDFAVDHSVYSLTNRSARNEIFFYARPTTARRGFELGIMALERFAQARPDITINLAGWDVSEYDIPFAHNNLAGVEVGRLSDLYNRCAAALVVSATNMSLLPPLELLAAGTAPVVNDAPNNRLVSDNPLHRVRARFTGRDGRAPGRNRRPSRRTSPLRGDGGFGGEPQLGRFRRSVRRRARTGDAWLGRWSSVRTASSAHIWSTGSIGLVTK